jgi:hypothetical protein
MVFSARKCRATGRAAAGFSRHLFTSGYKAVASRLVCRQPATVQGHPTNPSEIFSEWQRNARGKVVKLPPVSVPRANQSVGVCFWPPVRFRVEDRLLTTDIY